MNVSVVKENIEFACCDPAPNKGLYSPAVDVFLIGIITGVNDAAAAPTGNTTLGTCAYATFGTATGNVTAAKEAEAVFGYTRVPYTETRLFACVYDTDTPVKVRLAVLPSTIAKLVGPMAAGLRRRYCVPS